MKNCPLCGQELDDSVKFCKACGAHLDTPAAQPQTQIEEIKDEVVKKSKKSPAIPVIIATVLVLVAFGAYAVFGMNILNPKSPSEKILDSSFALMKSDSMETGFKMSINELSIGDANDLTTTMIANMVKDVGISGIAKYDKATKQMQLDMGISLRDTQLVSMMVYLNQESMIVSIPEIYEKPFFITYEEMKKRYQDETGETLNISMDQIMDLVNITEYDSYKDFDVKPYKELYVTFYDEHLSKATKEKITLANKEVAAEKYTMATDYKESMELSTELMKLAVNDPTVKAMILEVIDKAAEIAKTADTSFDEESIQTMKDEFITEWDALKEKDMSMESLMQNEEVDLSTLTMDYTYDFYLVDDIARKSVVAMKMSMTEDLGEEPVDMTIGVTAESTIDIINGKVEFTTIKKDECVDVLSLSEEELYDLGMEIQENASALIAGGLF